MPDYFLGVDLGTGSCKTAIIDSFGNLISQSQHEYELLHPEPLWAELRPDDLLRATVKSIKTVIRKGRLNPKDIRAVTIDSPRDSMIGVDKGGNPVTNCITWIDQRDARELEQLRKKISEKKAIQITGQPMEFANWGPKILWLRKKRSSDFRRIKFFFNPSNYITNKLVGQTASHVSAATRTMLFDINKLRWSEELCDIIDISVDMLPKLEKSITILDEFSDLARELHLCRGVPLSIAHSDDHCAAIGVGATEPGWLGISAGTQDGWYVPTSKKRIDTSGRLSTYPHAIPGSWLCALSISATGGSLRWFKDTFVDNEFIGPKNKKVDVYQAISRLAENVEPGARNLFFYPCIWGAKSPRFDPCAKGVFHGIRVEHTLAHFARSVLEGVAFQYIESLQIIESLKIEIKNISMTGGGAKSKLWYQIKANVIDRKILVPEIVDAASFGSAFLGGVAIDYFKDPKKAIRKMVRWRETYRPSRVEHEEYKRIFDRYLKTYEEVSKTYRFL